MHGAVTVVVKEHRHPAEKALLGHGVSAILSTTTTNIRACLPRNNILHIADVGPR